MFVVRMILAVAMTVALSLSRVAMGEEVKTKLPLSTELSLAAETANKEIGSAVAALDEETKRVEEEVKKELEGVLGTPAGAVLVVVHPKPSKFDENIEDKIYVDVKNCTKLDQSEGLSEPHQEVAKRKKRSYRTMHR
jgi:hypothetical protein